MKRLAVATLIASACSSDPGFVGEVPTNPDALLPWLEDERYTSWDREPMIHPTAGPHGQSVRTYFNLALAASLEAGNPIHQVESAAVKELYTDGLLEGWAVMVKTEDGEGADTWYWYEALDRTHPDRVFTGQGLDVCVGCHASGTDFVRSAWP